MMDEKTNPLVPKLRFPEFLDAGEWAIDSMGDLYRFHPTNSFSRDKLNYAEGQVKNIHYGDIHTKFATLFDVTSEYVPFINSAESFDRIRPESYCVEGDVVFADASEDMEDVGKSIEIVNTNNERIVSGLHTLLARQLNKKLIIGFGGYLFKSDVLRKQIKNEAQGAKVLGISSGRLSKIRVCFPSDKAEQQKIAECLSSLDALIAAQTEKIDVLKTHKKGLMQRLFPREGETAPRLRFPDYRAAGKWEKKLLGEVVEYTNGKAHEQNIDEKGKYVVVNSKFISTEGEIKKYSNTANLLANKDDILMVLSDVPNGRAIGKCFYVDSEDTYIVNQRICKLTAKSASSILLFYILDRNSYFLAFDDGAKQTNLKKNDVLECPMHLPKDEKEQKKIADCLSSLDEMIVAQTKKLNILKTHKKGLMQQLFPSPETVGV